MTQRQAQLTAWHEAGHAWAYARCGMPLRYLTIRPRNPGLTGVCRPWKPRRTDIGATSFIAAAGPIAEAVHDQAANTDPWLEWDDYLSGAVLAGGHDDLTQSFGLLDSPEAIERIRGQVEADWPGITRLAEQLLSTRTVSGRAAWELLGAT